MQLNDHSTNKFPLTNIDRTNKTDKGQAPRQVMEGTIRRIAIPNQCQLERAATNHFAIHENKVTKTQNDAIAKQYNFINS